jgi:glucan phosphoethanolaminetransferase (alkaline phosphatase superfamily)
MTRFHVPPPLLIAVLFLPLVALALIFQGRTRNMIIWHWSLQESYVLMDPKRRRNWTLFATACWFATFGVVNTADPSIPGFLNFSHDPIITFFKVKPTLFAMTRERVFWAQRDKQVELMSRGHVPKVHNVFLFVVDALRADHLPLYGYQRPLTPYFSGFLRKNHMRKVDLALSTGLDTITGTVCLMTSKEPAAMSAFDYTLPDYFYDQGFKTYLILAGDHHWQLQHDAFGKKIDLFYDGSEHPGPEGVCDDDLVLDRIDQLEPDNGGYHFFYIHLISVHPLGSFKDEFLQYKPTRSIIIDDTPFFGNTLPYVINRYDDRILQLDSVLKRIFTTLRGKGYLKDYVALLTADHGQILGEKGRYGHGRFADISGLRVPMIFFGSKTLPDFPETRFADQMDVAPTLGDLAGVDFPSCWQGQSLLRERKNPWSYHLSPYSHPKQEGALVHYSQDKIYKFSRRLEEKQADPGQVYELISDPLEGKDLLGKIGPKFLDEMRNQAHEHFTNF